MTKWGFNFCVNIGHDLKPNINFEHLIAFTNAVHCWNQNTTEKAAVDTPNIQNLAIFKALREQKFFTQNTCIDQHESINKVIPVHRPCNQEGPFRAKHKIIYTVMAIR